MPNFNTRGAVGSWKRSGCTKDIFIAKTTSFLLYSNLLGIFPYVLSLSSICFLSVFSLCPIFVLYLSSLSSIHNFICPLSILRLFSNVLSSHGLLSALPLYPPLAFYLSPLSVLSLCPLSVHVSLSSFYLYLPRLFVLYLPFLFVLYLPRLLVLCLSCLFVLLLISICPVSLSF
jgi:hypothetical protein